ncbi:MAG: type II toxin-antitoxin system VapC family toxin [Caulobacterales bacterium]|nr:type II toxin-antitoxin system VapC family toxin [Caulobacterales bacterium]
MAWLLDTSVAIIIRDADPRYRARIDALGGDVAISVITRVELEGGVYREPENTAFRRARLNLFLRNVEVLPFEGVSADAYQVILGALGFSRRKILDRMIAAQALVLDATLVTLNPADFADIPGLKLLAW